MSWSHRVHQVKRAVQHAFAVQPRGEPLGVDDVALLDRIATLVVDRGMAGPAVLFLESAGPMNFLGSQALHFFMPFLELACQTGDLERAAKLLERRDTLSRLIALIEAKASHQPRSSRTPVSGSSSTPASEPGPIAPR